jgi:DNA (cytosine-5)-methyltransferase 1
MIRLPNGKVRYFTIREAKRIQTFDDNYKITGSWSEGMRQIGNAVPVKLGEIIGRNLHKELSC